MNAKGFQTWLIERVREAGSESAVARKIGVAPNYVHKWVNGQQPSLEHFARAVKAYGGNLEDAFPQHEGRVQESLPVYGRVSAGTVSYAEQELRIIEGTPRVWSESVYRQHTTGPVIYIEVVGNSMEPEFPDGCLLACARPGVSILPQFTPVIARIDDQYTFKLYSIAMNPYGKKEVRLTPLNRAFQVQSYRLSDVHIDYVVVGFVNPWRHGITTGDTVPILRSN